MSILIDTQLIRNSLPLLWTGITKTVAIAGLSCSIGLTLGLLLGIIQSSNSPLRHFVFLYVTLIRGTPMLLQIVAAYSILLQMGFQIAGFWVAVCAIGLNSAAYISQVIRAGITAVGIGQFEAARVLGFSSAQTMYYIVLPQALRAALPSLGNEFVTLIKDSSLASAIGVVELFKQGQAIMSRTFDAFTVFAMVGVLYLALTSLVSIIVACIEYRLNYHAQNK